MKIQFRNIGKQHDSFVQEGIADFTKRINNYFPAEWLLLPPVKAVAKLSPDELKKKEAALLFGSREKDSFVVLLDETGKQLNNNELAGLINRQAVSSVRNLVFIIGGAFGVDETVKQQADFVWSLSKLVFPHMLVRLILAEQVYRACTILNNGKYHHY